MTVARTICLGFIAVILFGTFLLMLPFSHAGDGWGNLGQDFITTLFTSTSAVCVTGLVVVDTGSSFSFWGQLFIAMLIQVGGLGYMTANTFLLLLLGRRFGLKEKIAIQQSLDKEGMSGVVQLVKSIIATTLIFELTGMFLMLPVVIPKYGYGGGVWFALFHSISAFNNAGFGLLPDNMMSYVSSLPMNVIIPGLIIFGGMGYQVIMEMYFWLRDRLQRRRGCPVFSLNFKVAISTTLFLLILGTVTLFWVEYNNEGTFGSFSLGEKVIAAWFQGVVPRTAGFNSIDYGKMTDTGLFITIALMFIGTNPGGTGGGIKTTTARILYESTEAVLQGKEEVLCYERQIPTSLILKAVGVVFGSVITVVIMTTVMTLADPDIEFIRILFEAVSAFATVGLSTGITASVSVISKLTLIATMYVGRVGILLFVSTLLGDPTPSSVRYPEENLLVG